MDIPHAVVEVKTTAETAILSKNFNEPLCILAPGP
jgi:hypothetical protein